MTSGKNLNPYKIRMKTLDIIETMINKYIPGLKIVSGKKMMYLLTGETIPTQGPWGIVDVDGPKIVFFENLQIAAGHHFDPHDPDFPEEFIDTIQGAYSQFLSRP